VDSWWLSSRACVVAHFTDEAQRGWSLVCAGSVVLGLCLHLWPSLSSPIAVVGAVNLVEGGDPSGDFSFLVLSSEHHQSGGFIY
jgi:hypothetical protein